MKVDICINFNDLVPPPRMGMVIGKKPPYYQQLLYLVKSIKLNWDKNIYDYSIYVHHSRELAEEKKLELESIGCKVIFNSSETQTYFNRENILSYETDGDCTLILDTDILVLSTPSLDSSKEICARREGHSFPDIPISVWEQCYTKLGMKFKREEDYHFNGGVWFIKNTCKPQLSECFTKNLSVLEYLHGQSRHLSVQWYWSMLMKKFNWGLLDRKVNIFTHASTIKSEWSRNSDAEVIHYLGMNGMCQEVADAFKDIEERYEKL